MIQEIPLKASVKRSGVLKKLYDLRDIAASCRFPVLCEVNSHGICDL